VVLTGGGALLPGIDVLAEQVFGMPVRIGRPDRLAGPDEVTRDPSYATAVGLVRCGIEGKWTTQASGSRFWNSVGEEVKSWFS
jgi:cell division protein FtsA